MRMSRGVCSAPALRASAGDCQRLMQSAMCVTVRGCAGKSTMLDILARRKGGAVSGQVLLQPMGFTMVVGWLVHQDV